MVNKTKKTKKIQKRKTKKEEGPGDGNGHAVMRLLFTLKSYNKKFLHVYNQDDAFYHLRKNLVALHTCTNAGKNNNTDELHAEMNIVNKCTLAYKHLRQ